LRPSPLARASNARAYQVPRAALAMQLLLRPPCGAPGVRREAAGQMSDARWEGRREGDTGGGRAPEPEEEGEKGAPGLQLVLLGTVVLALVFVYPG